MSHKVELVNALSDARGLLIGKKYNEAVASYQLLIQSQPTNGELYLELSSCLISLGQLDEAIVVIKNALQYISANLEAACKLQLAQCYLSQHRVDEAANLFENVISLNQNDIAAVLGMATIHLKDGYPSKALAMLEPFKTQHENNSTFMVNYCLSLFECMEVDKALVTLLGVIQRFPKSKEAFSNAFLLSNYSSRHDHYLKLIKEIIRDPFPALDSKLALPIKKDKLRVGFVSGDFCLHPVGYFILSTLRELQNYDVEVYAYSNSTRVDFLTSQIKNLCRKFTQIYNLPAEQIVPIIRADNLDILIDLAGHTAGNRLDLFNTRIALVHASYLGYMESTNIPGMDYLITDKLHSPVEEQADYCEKLIYIPGCRFNFTPPIFAPAIGELPFLENGYITFGCFSNVTKFSDECLNIWAKVLLSIPGSRIKLRHKSLVDPFIQTKIIKKFNTHSVSSGRVEFYGGHKYDTYLKAYSEVDVMLDSIPFSGATTSCEALWMGVPIVTMHGAFPAARQTSCILSSVGEKSWIAQCEAEYLRIAQEAASQPDRLYKFRHEIRGKMSASSVGDPKHFTKLFVDALHEMMDQSSNTN